MRRAAFFASGASEATRLKRKHNIWVSYFLISLRACKAVSALRSVRACVCVKLEDSSAYVNIWCIRAGWNIYTDESRTPTGQQRKLVRMIQKDEKKNASKCVETNKQKKPAPLWCHKGRCCLSQASRTTFRCCSVFVWKLRQSVCREQEPKSFFAGGYKQRVKNRFRLMDN